MKLRLLLPLALAAITLASCKTTEANYRAAYTEAVNHNRNSSGVDSTIYSRIRNNASMSTLKVDGDTLPMRTEFIGYTDGGGASRDMVKTYNIVVAQFKQLFNARQMRERLQAAGYPETIILHTREPLYYVVTATVATPAEARAAYRKVKADKKIYLKPPTPFILRPAHLAR